MSQIGKHLDELRTSAADYTIGTLIAVMQMKMARRRARFLTPIILGHVIAQSIVPRAEPARRCACCDTTDDLVVDGSDAEDVVFCQDCATPRSSLDFPEYYCDLGGSE